MSDKVSENISTDAEPVGWQLVYHDGNVSLGLYTKSEAEDYERRSAFVVAIRPLYAAPTAPSVAVKDLEWHNSDEEGNDVWSCESDLAELYSITRWWLDDRRDEVGHFEVEELGERQFGTIEEAKAAAQADYEARIRSALSAQVSAE